MTEDLIDLIANDGCRNAAGGIYSTRVYEFANAIEAEATAPLLARIAELEAQIAAVAPAVDAQPVGVAGTMPGTDGCTMAAFKASEVPVGTPLYTSAQSEGLRKDAWQPIETAPKDGTPLILFARAKHATAGAPVVGWWIPDLGWIESAFSPNHPVGIVPSHWMPRPEFPAQKDPQ